MKLTYTIDRQDAEKLYMTLPTFFVEKFVPYAPEGYVKVFLYAFMQFQNPYFGKDDIALALNMSEEFITEAFEYWQKQGLLRIVLKEPYIIEFSLDVKAYRTMGEFDALFDVARKVFPERTLTPGELSMVADWSENLKLDNGCISELLGFAKEKFGKRVPFSQIEKIAIEWSESLIFTQDAAKEYISRRSDYEKGAQDVLRRWNLRRKPTQDEIALYERWRTEYGLSDEVISELSGQMLSAQTPSFKYLSEVVDSYRGDDIVSLDELHEKFKEDKLHEDFCRQLFLAMGLSTPPTRDKRDRILVFLNEGLSKDLLLFAAEQAKIKERPYAYFNKVCTELMQEKITDFDEAKDYIELSAAKPKSKKYSPKTQFGSTQKKYTKEELELLNPDFNPDDQGE